MYKPIKKRSSVQLVIDENQNIRINNLSLDEHAELFDNIIDEINLSNNLLSHLDESPQKIIEIEKDIQSVIELYDSCEICFRKCKVNRNKGELGVCLLNSQDNVYMTTILNDEEKIICPTYAIYLSPTFDNRNKRTN